MSDFLKTTIQDLVQAGIIENPVDGNHGEIHPKSSDYVDSGVPFVMASDLKGGRVNLATCKFISEKQAAQLRKGFSRAGDVLLSHKATIGRTAIVQKSQFPFVVLTPQVTYYRVADHKKLLPSFLRCYFESKPFQSILSAWAGGGSTRAYLGITAQLRLPVELPNLAQQQCISSIMGVLDDKIDLNRQMNETLEAMARALFKDWFVDFGPTRAKMAGQKPYLAQDIWDLFPDRLDDEGKPEGWKFGTIYDIASVQYGAPFSSKIFNTSGDGVPLIRIRDLQNEAPGVFTTEMHPKGFLVQPGMIVVGMDGEFRAHLWGGETAWLNQRVCVFMPKDGISSPFVRETIIPQLKFIEDTEVATTVIHLGKGDIDGFSSLLPTRQARDVFNKIAQPLYDRIVMNKREARSLSQMRDLLLPKLMSGEIRIKDAEKLVEEVA